MEKAKEGDAFAKLFMAFLRKAGEGAFGRSLVETAILLSLRSQQGAAKALREADHYKVSIESVAATVK